MRGYLSVGTYDVAGQDLVVTLEDDQLMGEPIGQLSAESETHFFNEDNYEFEFVRGDDGIVTHVIVRSGAVEVTAPRKSSGG